MNEATTSARAIALLTGWREKLAIYGRLGVGVYVAVALVTTGAAFTLIEAGLGDRIPWLTEHPAGPWATLAVAWYAAKVPRIALTLALTPLVARWTGRAPPEAAP